MLETGARPSRAGARLAREIDAEPRVTVVAADTALAVLAVGQVSAVDTVAGALVADGRVAVALARPAVGEGPEARLALIALATRDPAIAALALSCNLFIYLMGFLGLSFLGIM